MGKLPIRRSMTSERSSVQPSRPTLAPPAAVRRSAQPGLSPALSPEAGLQRAALLGHNVLQAKLTLGPVGDSYEREADSVARQVVQQISSPAPEQAQRAPKLDEDELKAKSLPGVQRAMPKLDEEDLKKKPMPGGVQRAMPKLDEEDLKKKPMPGAVQRNGGLSTAEGGPIGGDVERSIEGARSGGRSLDSGVRVQMEPAFGADFSGVKVHSDSKADGLNKSLQARAFTTGQDIFFRKGEYNPGSAGGKELLAHELTHVVQQNGPTVAKKPAR
jgi:hypothetical protein